MNIFTKHIAAELQLSEKGVDGVLTLLQEGCTIPFIARYRKEVTGAMDEVAITSISNLSDKLTELSKRKETIVKTIEGLGKLTDELRSRIDSCWDANILEDIYMPYKPKRRTRAQAARELGLQPLADLIMLQRERDVERAAHRFVTDDVPNVDKAIAGAKDIIAEQMCENEQARNAVRGQFRRTAIITSKVVKAKKDDDEAQKYSDYFDWSESLKRCTSHRLLAMRRGEADGILKVTISVDGEECQEKVLRQYHIYNSANSGSRLTCTSIIIDAVADGLKRLLIPQIETEFAALSKEKADAEAISVFAENLRQLLLGAPLGQKRVMGIDPGIRTGCKVVCLDAQGSLLFHDVIFPMTKRALSATNITRWLTRYNVEAIAIGNGTASRETADFIRDLVASLDLEVKPQVFVVSEDGASVYSASKIARDEFPDKDVTVRGAVSIARRLMDPLAELVKIDPKSIGVGQYQHDVDQRQLKQSLDRTVESCVNLVGVDVNTASQQLLTYVSGLGPTLAKNIVDYRTENGAFGSRAQLKKVPRLGAAAFQQCAGFLRISEPQASSGARWNPLDNSAVHPESYYIVEQMARDNGCTVRELIASPEIRKGIDPKKYVAVASKSGDSVGLFTINDILKELDKPGRDPRQQIEVFEFDARVKTPADLVEGMELPGIVTNITNFGAFVDIGVHQDGLVHISQLADKYVTDPTQVVHLHQHVRVRVIGIDNVRHRISLTMKL